MQPSPAALADSPGYGPPASGTCVTTAGPTHPVPISRPARCTLGPAGLPKTHLFVSEQRSLHCLLGVALTFLAGQFFALLPLFLLLLLLLAALLEFCPKYRIAVKD